MNLGVYDKVLGLLLIGVEEFEEYGKPVDWKFNQIDKARDIFEVEGLEAHKASLYANEYKMLIDKIYSDKMLFDKRINIATNDALLSWIDKNIGDKTLEQKFFKARLELKSVKLFSDDPNELSRKNHRVQKLARKLERKGLK